MAKLVFAMNLSLDGYVDHESFAPDPVLFRHWISEQRRLTASLYGRRLYDLMRYWEEDRPEWSEDERDFATAWRRLPKFVASRTLAGVGPNATQVKGVLETEVRRLKDELPGEIDVGGPVLAAYLAQFGLIDVYRLYYHPVVLGRGAPFFPGPRPALRFVAQEQIGPSVVCLTYAPA